MEKLDAELRELMNKLDNPENFQTELDKVQNIYPFNNYEYIISKLLNEKILSYDQYIEMRNEYINRNLFLYVFEISAPRGFGDTWGFSHLISVEPELKRPNKKIDPNYKGEYDLCLPYNGKIIKIEVKGSRAVNKNKPSEPLYMKALNSQSDENFLMNFQQVKPSCSDVMLWFAVYRDCVKYWVMKSSEVYKLNFTPQHRNLETDKRTKEYEKTEIYEGQIMITKENIDSIKKYETEGRKIRQAIIEEFEK